MLRILGCFVKRFYFVWREIIRITLSVQECVAKAVSIAVPPWCAVSMTKVGIGIAIG